MEIWDKQLLNIKEQVYIIYLNDASEVINWDCLNTGNCSETLFDIKYALACALCCMSCKIIVAHNHPSGLLSPSVRDIQMTERLSQAASLIDVKLTDHIILSGQGYFSFVDNRMM